MSMASPPKATVILEINLISAQELPSYKASNMKTYVVAWIDPQQKLTSRVDATGDKNPTWNDKFIFAINLDLALERPNTTLIFELYSKRRFRRNKLIGKVHVLLDTLTDRKTNWAGGEGIRGKAMAFNVRTPSGIPQGILNIGVMNLDGLFNQAMLSFLGSSLAIDYRKLMGIHRGGIMNFCFGGPKYNVGKKQQIVIL